MKIAAVVAEYNPFHNGHSYQLAQIRNTLDVDRIVVVMSGNFVQRGAPAMFDKYTRTKLALAGGADFVIELPVHFALGSAEFFAHGAVSILHALGNVSYLHFGSECGDLSLLQKIAEILVTEPAIYKESLQKNLKTGMTFPQARINAFQSYAHQHSHWDDVDDAAVLSSPNNILGIEYLKALKRLGSSITPVTLQRSGAHYHEQSLSTVEYPSASGLRSLFAQHNDLSILKPYMPHSVWNMLQTCAPFALNEDHFSQMLHYKLLSLSTEQLFLYQDVTSDLAVRITNLLPEYTSFSNFAALVKTKDITYSRVSRILFHILLDIKKESYQLSSDSLYCRILGFRKESTDLLKAIKQTSSIPMISKLADAPQYLSAPALHYLKADLHAADLYRAVITATTMKALPNEYRQEIIRF